MLYLFVLSITLFFFKQKTAYEMRISDWSSDVRSSDLGLSSAPSSPPPIRSLHSPRNRPATKNPRRNRALEQMTAQDYERLVKLMAMLASDNDGEVLNAVSAASRILNGYGLTWPDVVLPRRLRPVRASAAEAVAMREKAGRGSPPPPATRTSAGEG